MRLDRLNEMEQYVLDHGSSSLEELCQHFSVSMNTVRRDIADLVQRGHLKKVYGGVSAGIRPPAVIPISERSMRNDDAKQIIGRLAATLVQDNTSIFLDSGSTTLRILPYLAEKQNVTVITHSLMALYEAAKYPSLHVIALGGMYNYVTSSFVGANTLDELSKMAINLVFLASTGVTLERGLTNTTYFEVEVKQTVARQNKNLVLMADHTKFGHDALLTFCGFDDLSAVVTDQPLPESYMDAIARRGIRLITPASEGTE
ncbi:MAG TPA: DeoR/GlpR family DNA-binding transcription regulator [Eubacteriales bacterium]|nr:DeoR/GlpR family DNA-binding transcription regulator [Eubacteriales bacterium]